MTQTINLSFFILALMSSTNTLGMLAIRACHQSHRVITIRQQQRWCNKMSPPARIEFIQAFVRANYEIEKIMDRNHQAIMIMLEQNRIGQQIITANLKSIGNLKSNTNYCEIYDMREGVELFDQLEKRLTKSDQSFE